MRKEKMKKRNILLVSGVIIILSLFSGFKVSNDSEIIVDLLAERTKTLQQALFREISLEEAEQSLKNIETNPLLAEDIKNLRDFQETDIERIKNMKVIDIISERKILEYKTYDLKLLWEMESYDRTYFLENTYYVVLKEIGGTYKLSNFNPK